MLTAFIAANTSIFAAWRYAMYSDNYRLANVLSRATIVRAGHLRGGLPLLLSAFTHLTPLHFALNMYVLDNVTRPLVAGTTYRPTLSPLGFAGLYLSSGIAGALASAAHFRLSPTIMSSSVGASGAIFGILSYFCLEYPQSGFSFMFVLPLTASGLLWGGLGVNAAIMLASTRFPLVIDGAGHIGGTLAGMAFHTAFSKKGGPGALKRSLPEFLR